MSRKRYAGPKPEPKMPPSDDEHQATSSDEDSETEQVGDDGEPGNDFA